MLQHFIYVMCGIEQKSFGSNFQIEKGFENLFEK